MSAATTGPDPSAPAERFTQPLKACRDILVDDVERCLGVPIIGQTTPIDALSAGDVEQARRHLTRAIDALSREPEPGPHASACRALLDDVSRLLGAPQGVTQAAMVSTRQLRHARRQLKAAVEHLTTVLFDEPDPPPDVEV